MGGFAELKGKKVGKGIGLYCDALLLGLASVLGWMAEVRGFNTEGLRHRVWMDLGAGINHEKHERA